MGWFVAANSENTSGLFLEANQAPYLAKLVFITGIIRLYIWIYDRYIYVNEDLWNISLEYVLDTNMGYIELLYIDILVQ